MFTNDRMYNISEKVRSVNFFTQSYNSTANWLMVIIYLDLTNLLVNKHKNVDLKDILRSDTFKNLESESSTPKLEQSLLQSNEYVFYRC